MENSKTKILHCRIGAEYKHQLSVISKQTKRTMSATIELLIAEAYGKLDTVDK